jgi:hypothetical protein
MAEASEIPQSCREILAEIVWEKTSGKQMMRLPSQKRKILRGSIGRLFTNRDWKMYAPELQE